MTAAYIALVFVACLGDRNDRCQTVELSTLPPITECQVHAQESIAHWLDQHEGYRQRGRWACEIGRGA